MGVFLSKCLVLRYNSNDISQSGGIGRLAVFRRQFPKGSAGSSPASGTSTRKEHLLMLFCWTKQIFPIFLRRIYTANTRPSLRLNMYDHQCFRNDVLHRKPCISAKGDQKVWVRRKTLAAAFSWASLTSNPLR